MGELVIDIPQELINYSHNKNFDNYKYSFPFLIRIEYSVDWKNDGYGLIYCDDSNYPHLYSYTPSYSTDCQDNLGCGTRLWIPCNDCIGSRCEWEFYITVPRNMKCICTGNLIDIVNSIYEDKVIYIYNINIPTSPSCISLAIGPFEVINENNEKHINCFVLPDDRLKNDIDKGYETMIDVVNFYLNILKIEYPNIDGFDIPLSLIYVYNLPCNFAYNSTIIYINSNLISGPNTTDGEIEFRSMIASGVASLWFGYLINNANWTDKWIIVGLTCIIILLLL